MDKSDSAIARLVADNMEFLLTGGKLLDENTGDVLTIVEITLEDEGLVPKTFEPEEFSELIEYVEPKTKREEALELRITVLEDQLAHATTTSAPVLGSEVRPRKIPVTLSESQEKIVVQYYLDHKESKIKIKEISAKYNISDRSTSMILEKHGVRIPGKRQRKITYAE